MPALRVLDQKKNKDKSSDLIEDGLEGGEEVKEKDVVDERGIVDGVKVARKISKANVLGKATEYIRCVLSFRFSVKELGDVSTVY